MKKIILIAILLVNQLFAQDITGSWMNWIDAGGAKIRLVFNISKTAKGYATTFDSPDQNAFGIPTSKTIFMADSIFIEIPAINGGYKGKWNGTDEINGIYYQAKINTAFNLKRLAAAEIPKPKPPKLRPQTPKPPYTYISEDVVYYNADKSVKFGASFTKPKGDSAFTTVIIISGSGTQDRDGTMAGHKTYGVLADYLTNNGIAVLRVDDRGAGKTTLGKNYMQLTSADFANDVEASMQYLQTRKDVSKIGLIGHSEGGMIAPMVAARNKDVQFIVLLAGPGQTGEEIWKYQMRRAFEKPNLSKANKKLADELVNKINDAFINSSNYDTIVAEMKETYKNWKINVSDSVQKNILHISGVDEFTNMVQQYRSGLTWLQYFLKYNPAVNLQAVKCPVLATNGESDVQVLCKENLAAINKALKKGKNKNYIIKSFPNLNHLFQTCATKEQAYDDIEETFSPTAMAFIVDWIKGN